MLAINYCFHSHTSRCGHATGTDEEYVLEAIKAGIKNMGFSDHVFIPNRPQRGIRGNYEELDDYISSVRALASKYKDKINIFVGFEAEDYNEISNDYYRDLLKNKIDYLIRFFQYYVHQYQLKLS